MGDPNRVAAPAASTMAPTDTYARASRARLATSATRPASTVSVRMSAMWISRNVARLTVRISASSPASGSVRQRSRAVLTSSAISWSSSP